MALPTMETTDSERRMATENSCGVTTLDMRANLQTTTSTAMESIDGQTTENIQAIGLTTRCTELASSPGMTEENTKVAIKTTRNTVMESSCGQTVDNTTACGLMASRKAQASIATIKEKPDSGSGRMEKDRSGSLKTSTKNL
jgi:hypothetical protein